MKLSALSWQSILSARVKLSVFSEVRAGERFDLLHYLYILMMYVMHADE
jgi:hypothetical protein